jgi:hypothetical protein
MILLVAFEVVECRARERGSRGRVDPGALSRRRDVHRCPARSDECDARELRPVGPRARLTALVAKGGVLELELRHAPPSGEH